MCHTHWRIQEQGVPRTRAPFSVQFLPPATKLGQGNIFTGVCDSVHRGCGVPQCMLGYHNPPGTRHPPGPGRYPWDQAGTLPWDQVGTPWTRQTPPRTRQAPPLGAGRHPPEQSILGDTVNERAVCILLECILVSFSIKF